MSDFTVYDELSKLIAGPTESDVPHWRRGYVTAMDMTTPFCVTVRLHGSTTDLARVRLGAGCAARTGNEVWVYRLGNTMVAWGSPVTPWITPTLTNGWVRFDVAAYPPQYRGYVNGDVQLRGIAKNGTINLAMFTLPVGFRPVITNGYNAPCASNAAFGYVSINSSGGVFPVVGNNAWFSLDNHIFSTLPE